MRRSFSAPAVRAHSQSTRSTALGAAATADASVHGWDCAGAAWAVQLRLPCFVPIKHRAAAVCVLTENDCQMLSGLQACCELRWCHTLPHCPAAMFSQIAQAVHHLCMPAQRCCCGVQVPTAAVPPSCSAMGNGFVEDLDNAALADDAFDAMIALIDPPDSVFGKDFVTGPGAAPATQLQNARCEAHQQRCFGQSPRLLRPQNAASVQNIHQLRIHVAAPPFCKAGAGRCPAASSPGQPSACCAQRSVLWSGAYIYMCLMVAVRLAGGLERRRGGPPSTRALAPQGCTRPWRRRRRHAQVAAPLLPAAAASQQRTTRPHLPARRSQRTCCLATTPARALPLAQRCPCRWRSHALHLRTRSRRWQTTSACLCSSRSTAILRHQAYQISMRLCLPMTVSVQQPMWAVMGRRCASRMAGPAAAAWTACALLQLTATQTCRRPVAAKRHSAAPAPCRRCLQKRSGLRRKGYCLRSSSHGGFKPGKLYAH